MPIGIMSAMREEIAALLDKIETTDKVVKGMRTYYRGILWNKEVVLVFSRWGKVASATTATHLINDFKVDEILFTGVAGAIELTVSIGDVIIGRELFQHDMDASPLIEPYEVPLLRKKFFSTDPDRNLLLASSVERFLKQKEDFIHREQLDYFGISDPRKITGQIASGDQFISESKKIDKIRIDLPEVLCVEMEGAAVAQVCYEYQLPFNIIRTISDNADDNSHIDFPRFASEVASRYALGIIKNYFDSF
jgi:adenosylhomocysteine nucleosidase